MQYIDKLGWLCINSHKILVARSKGKEVFDLPGGKRDDGESDIEALTREIKEELSVELKPSTIKYAETFKTQAHGKADGTLVKITCYFAEFVGKLKADSEIEEICWLRYQDKEKCAEITQLIIDWLKSNALIE